MAVAWDSCSLPGKKGGTAGEGEAGELPFAASANLARDLSLPLGGCALEGEKQPAKGHKGHRNEMEKQKLCFLSQFWGPKPKGRDHTAGYLDS